MDGDSLLGNQNQGDQNNQNQNQNSGDQGNQNQNQNNQGGNASGGGSGLAAIWDSLPDDLKGNQSFSQFKDKGLADVLKAYGDVDSKLKGAIVVPGEGATDEQKAEFQAKVRQALGVPEKPEAYQVKVEGIPADDPMLKNFIGEAHKMGLTNEQVQNATAWFAKHQTEAWTQQQTTWKGELSTHYGNKLEEAGVTAMKGLEGLAKDAGLKPEDVRAAVFGLGMNVHPVFFRILERAGAFYKEDSSGGNQGNGDGGQKSFAEILYPSHGKQ
jgi:hypothetical protein